MKIAIITSGFLPVVDGVTVSGLYRLQRLSKWGHEVILFCPDYSNLEKIYPNWRDYTGEILPGIRVINLASTEFFDVEFERNVSRQSYQTVLKELTKFQPDIIHVDEPERLFTGFLKIPGVDYAKTHNIPCVSFFRTNFLEYLDDYFPLPLGGTALIKLAFKQLLRWIYNSYDATLIHSQVTHQKLIELGIKNTIYENLNGFDDSKFNTSLKQSGFFAQTYNNPSLDEQIKLIFLGRLTPDKGWGFTMKAFAEVSKKVDLSKVAILIAGDGEMREIIQQTLEKYVPNLYMLGRVAPEKIPALLANCDVHVTTSEKENRALTVIEALAVGVPVVAPRAGGVVQDVQPGVTGLLFEPQNIEDFAAKIKEIVYNQELRLTMGLKGREYISKYTWDNTITNLVKIWQQQIQLKSR